MSGLEDQVARYQSQLEERQSFVNQLMDTAGGRDLNEHEMRLVTDATDKMKVLNGLIVPLGEAARVARDSRDRFAEIQAQLTTGRNPKAAMPAVEYRSAGQYVVDKWAAAVGHEDARERLNLYHRAAAHQTTADNLGVIPEPVVGPVINYIDTARPIVSALGPTDVPGGRFVVPRVTQHTDVAVQSAEKAELISRKMLIERVSVNMSTYGGYVNVSRQDIDWSVPSIMDIVIQDLAGQYAIETESVTATAVAAGSTAQTPVITASSTAAEVNAAIWKSAGASYTAMQGTGRLVLAVSPDMMAAIGPLFPGVNPTNAVSSGFSAGSFSSGPQGTISGITVVMSAALAAGKAFMINTSAARVFEQRLGSLQVIEPSVLGVQVAYAGYFAAVVLTATGIIKLTA